MDRFEDLLDKRAKATSGPWQIQHDEDRWGRTTIIANVDSDDEGGHVFTTIGEVDGTESPEDERNAAFIVAAENALPGLIACVEALQEIADSHIPDQPAASPGDELYWAQRHVGTLRGIAQRAIAKAKGKA